MPHLVENIIRITLQPYHTAADAPHALCLPALTAALRYLFINNPERRNPLSNITALDALLGALAPKTLSTGLRIPATAPCTCDLRASQWSREFHNGANNRWGPLAGGEHTRPSQDFVEAEFAWTAWVAIYPALDGYIVTTERSPTTPRPAGTWPTAQVISSLRRFGPAIFQEVFQGCILDPIRDHGGYLGAPSVYFHLLALLCRLPNVQVPGIVGREHYELALRCLGSTTTRANSETASPARRGYLVYQPLKAICQFLRHMLLESPPPVQAAHRAVFRALPPALLQQQLYGSLMALEYNIPKDVCADWRAVCLTLGTISGGRFSGVVRRPLEGFDMTAEDIYGVLWSYLQQAAKPRCSFTGCRRAFAPGVTPRCLECHFVLFCSFQCAKSAHSDPSFPHALRCTTIQDIRRRLNLRVAAPEDAQRSWHVVVADRTLFVQRCVAKSLDLDLAREAIHVLLVDPEEALFFL
ncbi:hypothetical protein MKEN_00937800 [Mycena kentingensis (nom. inval.)]|nr:hypothetical protein MKEN_00937800 [Mycena kentingensis (nom. inval.)]